MSTRRARIKAVASLPVRRKNAEAKEATKPIENENIIEIKNEEGSLDSAPEQATNNSAVNEAIKQPALRRIAPKTPIIIENTLSSSNTKNIIRPSVINESPLKRRDLAKASPSPRHHKRSRISNQSKCESDSELESIQKTLPIQAPSGNNQIDTPKQNEQPQRPSVIKLNVDHEIIDGIVPLQSAPKAKPFSVLKNDIITENAEVIFDPILPLPTNAKVRHKLRPAPKLGFRRNSSQGSASESDDEARRSLALNSNTPGPSRQRHDSQTSISSLHISNKEVKRIRNDSVCSNSSQNQTITASPHKDKFLPCKPKRVDSRRVSALRRRQRIKDIKCKEKLTMYDLIFYNPNTNPMLPDKDEEEVKKLTELDEENVNKTDETAQAEKVDDSKGDDPEDKDPNNDDPNDEEDSTPAPQIKIGPDGKIVLDEKSLVIQETESKRKLEDVVVREGSWSTGKGKYTRTARSLEWSEKDTVRFYRALAAVGTDFSIMAHLFPKRTRRELKIKFKKEERSNGVLVDKALESSVPWDVANLADEFAKEREDEAKKKEEEYSNYLKHKEEMKALKLKLKCKRVKVSHGNDAVNIYDESRNVHEESPTLDEILDRSKPSPPLKKQRKLPARKQYTDTYGPPYTGPIRTIVPSNVSPMSVMPQNLEKGSLVVLSVDDPNDPTKKILQTYMSAPDGQLTAVNLPSGVMSSVAGYIKKTSATPPRSRTSSIRTPSSVRSHSSNMSQSSAR